MALRNAFEEMATERILRRVLEAVRFSRTSTDQLRVVCDSGAIDVSGIRWGANNSQPAWYSTGSVNSMDAREQQRQVMRQTFNDVRLNRWTFS